MSADSKRLSRQELYNVAIYQKGILWCILAYLIAVFGQFAVPPSVRLLVGIVFTAVAALATVFVFLLALNLYGVAMGIVLGILTLIPCIGLITLLVINQKATGLLNKRGYRVGLLGAKLSQFKRKRSRAEEDDDYDEDNEDRSEARGRREEEEEEYERPRRSRRTQEDDEEASAEPPPLPRPQATGKPIKPAMSDKIAVKCPICQKALKVPEHVVGKKVKCPSCGGAFVA
jgi:hypothetical protein